MMTNERISLVFRGCRLVTPYRAGFEDTFYDREYRNPYPIGCADWVAYDNGNIDARAAIQSNIFRHVFTKGHPCPNLSNKC